MENFENNNQSLEEKLRLIQAEIESIEAFHPRERNDVELVTKLRELKQKAVQIKVDMDNGLV